MSLEAKKNIKATTSESLSCKLCAEIKPLQRSHIIPQSYFRRLKNQGGQLLKVSSDETTPPILDNCDPKDRLLCWDCEQFINKNYEQLGTQFFKKRPSTVVMQDYIKIKKFKYRIIYLYFMSILWRVSESSLPQYRNINLGDISPVVRECLRRKNISLNSQVRLDHFIKICVVRITEKSNNIPDSVIKKCLMDMTIEKGEKPSEGILYYFMIDGFLITYLFKMEGNFELQKAAKYLSQLEDRSSIKIQKVDISELSSISKLFSTLTRKVLEAGPPR